MGFELVVLFSFSGVFGILFFIILENFYKKDSVLYLRFWSLSWLFYGINYLLSAYLWYLISFNQSSPFKDISSILSIASSFLSLALLLIGFQQFVKGLKWKKHHYYIFGLAILLLAIILFLPYRDDSSGRMERWILRIGIKSLFLSLSYVYGVRLLKKLDEKLKGTGYKILMIFLLLGAMSNLLVFGARLMTNFIEIEGSLIEAHIFIWLELLTSILIGVGIIILLMENQTKRLSEANAQLDSFLYSTSHDLRAPIASILGLINLMKLEKSKVEQSSYISMIEERLAKLDNVIRDILDYARSSKYKIKKEEINFHNILNEAIDTVKFNEGAPEIKLVYEKPTDPIFFSDSIKLKIILENLISNSVKYHNLRQENPFLEIAFLKASGNVTIKVKDNGKGIEESALEDVFKMFYRIDLDTEGTGLGLYIVKESVKNLGGTVGVKSKKGYGTTFTISLPQ